MSTYNLDPAHSSASFSIRHMMIANVHGSFAKITGTLVEPNNQAISSLDATIDVDSISTGEPQRDTHLKSADFFDVATYPSIKFVSTKVEKTSDTSANVTGDLTIRDVTKQVVLDVEGETKESKDPYGNLRVGFTATTKIKRSDFGLHFNVPLEGGGVVVGDDVKITIEAQFIKA
jgi:polyisoprenoid-binding protein YceI